MIRKLSITIFIISIILILSCNEEETVPSVLEQEQLAVPSNVSSQIIVPSYKILNTKIGRLAADVETFKLDLNVDNLIALRVSLKEARLAWQWCNLYDFGPAADAELSSILNTFPIDEEGIEENIEVENFAADAIIPQDEKSLVAIAYLLHGTEITDDQIVQQFVDNSNRPIYLEQVVGQVSRRVTKVVQNWTANSESYLFTFQDNIGTNDNSSLSLLTNAITRTFERKVRDSKIAIPLGQGTGSDPSPNSVEALYGGYSVELIRESIKAYQNLFKGQSLMDSTAPDVDGESFIYYLNAIDNTNLAEDLEDGFTKSITAVSQLSEPYHEEVINNPNPSANALNQIQQLITIIKSDMTAAMGINITFQNGDGG
ncbi:MAG: imelysin family protein [Bacteroidota bacterium]